MGVRFQINAWAGCGPELTTAEQWRQWSAAPALPRGSCDIEIPEVPAMLRRRLGPLGRMVAWVAARCQGARAGIPVVFASRYGDAERSLSLLDGFAGGEPMSPNEFALSVHNAIGAIHSIARGDRAASTSIAGGAASAAAGCVEAACLLGDGAPEVMLVCYDAPLPGSWREFEREPAAPYAWAWLMAPAASDSRGISLDWQPASHGCEETGANAGSPLPFGLDAMRFAVSGDASWQRACEGRRWRWSRHA
jgi:hypothetical protein